MRLRKLTTTLVIVILVGIALFYSHNKINRNNQPYETRFGPIMGTEGYVKIDKTEALNDSAENIFNKAYQKTKQAEALLSRFIASSDVSRINAAAVNEKIQISPVTWQALLEARRFYQLSDGKFDPTVGALMNIYPWGEKEIASLPDLNIVKDALNKSGLNHLTFHREGMYISKNVPGLIVDLGGIAKGLGVDIMASALKSAGVTEAIIEIGGEITVIGSVDFSKKSSQLLGSAEKVWTTGIKDPRGNGIIKKFAATGGVSIATSGDYEKYFMLKGKRYSHIIDPATGYPTTSRIISATVITRRSCTIADALATTISVIGVEKSEKLLELFPETEAFLVLEDKSQISLKGGVKDLELPGIIESSHD